MKKLTKIFIFLSSILCFSSCKAKTADMSQKVQIVCSIFPIYDWTHNLTYAEKNTNDNKILSLLIKSGINIHDFKPSETDINQIKKCDIFIYIGGESDNWINPILEEKTNSKMITVRLMDYFDLDDQHIWLSPKCAQICCQKIFEALCTADSENTELYTKRLNNYLSQLSILDKTFENQAKELSNQTLIFADNFPCTCMFNDYGINYFSPYGNCTNKTTMPEDKIQFLAGKLNEYKLKSILVTQNSDQKYAKSIIMASNHKFDDIYVIDTMETTSLREAFNGKTYIKTMQNNFENTKKALNTF